jgi:YD repeat-containing protein
MRLGVLALTLSVVPGCTKPDRSQRAVFVVETGAYQAYYDSQGRLRRMHFDGNGDRRVDAVLLFRESGTLHSAEIDRDRDGTVDRFELYDAHGALKRVRTE